MSLAYTADTAEKAGYTVITPPAYLLSGRDYQGSPDRVWYWVQQNMDRADAAVLSTDTLIYGGLVDSRKHNESLEVLTNRADRLRTLHRTHPDVPIYAFGTIMRTPYASSSGVEPYYYANYGTSIYRISGLQDKMNAGTITPSESAELLALKLSVPTEYLQDWFERRTKNTIINKRLIEDVKDGVFTYFCLGFDDSSRNSQSALEARYLKEDAKGLSEKVYGSFPALTSWRFSSSPVIMWTTIISSPVSRHCIPSAGRRTPSPAMKVRRSASPSPSTLPLWAAP